MFRIGPFSYDDCLHIAEHMVAEDVLEMKATSPQFTPEGLAALCDGYRETAVIAYKGDTPVATIGVIPVRQGVYSCYMFVTDLFPMIGLGMTRWAKRVYFPGLRAMGAHRVETHIIESHTKTHSWLRAIGMKREAFVPCFGAGKENFVRYSKVWEN